MSACAPRLPTGVRALDAFATFGQGQRVGLFAGSGVGKSRLLGTLAPAEHLRMARWMVPALSPAERAGFMSGLQARMAPDAFQAVLDTIQPHLDSSGWIKLMRALGAAKPAADETPGAAEPTSPRPPNLAAEPHERPRNRASA